jgi:hypothetical protein
MKNFKRSSIIKLIALIVSAPLFLSCETDEPSAKEEEKELIITGTWTQDTVIFNETEPENDWSSFKLTINKDSSY